MIVSFKDTGTRDVYEGNDTRDARKTCPQHLWRVAIGKLQRLDSAVTLLELAEPPGNRLEKLTGDRAGQWSIRVNLQYRICFQWTGGSFASVGIADYH